MKFKTIARNKQTKELEIIEMEYKTKKQFIKDLRGNGYQVNRKKVKPAEVFNYIMENTDCAPWDWEEINTLPVSQTKKPRSKKNEYGLTDMETRLMNTIPLECFYEQGFESILWTDCFLDTLKSEEDIDQKQGRALLVTLEKKGFIWVTGNQGTDRGRNDGTLGLQEKGQQYLLEQGLVNEEGHPIREA